MISDKSSHDDMKAQIVIIGGGGAGLAAAVAAAEKGVKAIVLEKRAKLGGNARMAEGLAAAESDVQIRAKIEARRDDLLEKQWILTTGS